MTSTRRTGAYSDDLSEGCVLQGLWIPGTGMEVLQNSPGTEVPGTGIEAFQKPQKFRVRVWYSQITHRSSGQVYECCTPRITQNLTFYINVRRQREKIATLRYDVFRKNNYDIVMLVRYHIGRRSPKCYNSVSLHQHLVTVYHWYCFGVGVCCPIE